MHLFEWTDGLEFSLPQHAVAELRFTFPAPHNEHWDENAPQIEVHTPSGAPKRMRPFWRGGNQWAVRIAPRETGRHQLRTVHAGLTLTATFNGSPYSGNNVFMKHGPVTLDPSTGYFQHTDGTPFFLLADSWWFGMSERLRWPHEFQYAVEDRAQKGFTAIQFAVDFPCDIPPFDPRAANEAGHGWQPDGRQLNPAYWDLVDERIVYLMKRGILAGIVGAWGYYLSVLGLDRMKAHWRYIIARYSALPVWWILCGEARLVYYKTESGKRDEAVDTQRQGWTEIACMIQEADPEGHPLTAHIGPKPGGKDLDPLTDMSPLDFIFTQPGHSDYDSVPSALAEHDLFKDRYPDKPVFIGECAFEGMHGGGCGPKVQRNLFWTMVCRGAPGHCYGTDAMWQMNREDDPFGASVSGHIWGNTPWQEAVHWPGSEHLGVAHTILRQIDYTRLRRHPEWIDRPATGSADWKNPHAAGSPGEYRLIYFPDKYAPWSPEYTMQHLEPGIQYSANYFDPITGEAYPLGEISGNEDGEWKIPRPPILQDWVLILSRETHD